MTPARATRIEQKKPLQNRQNGFSSKFQLFTFKHIIVGTKVKYATIHPHLSCPSPMSAAAAAKSVTTSARGKARPKAAKESNLTQGERTSHRALTEAIEAPLQLIFKRCSFLLAASSTVL